MSWDQSFSSNSLIQMKVTSNDILNINITSTLMELYKTVKENWTQDYDSANKYERLVCLTVKKTLLKRIIIYVFFN